GIDHLTVQEAGRRYPQIEFAGVDEIYFEPSAGVLLARESCRVVAAEFVNLGGTYRTAAAAPLPALDQTLDELRLIDGTSIRADQFVLACGPWLGSVLPDLLGEAISPTRQEVYYFGTPPSSTAWQPESLPVWVELGQKVVYGFPDNLGRGFKFADDTRGPIVDPNTLQRTPTAELVEAARQYLGKRFPALAQAPLLEARVCQYENSPDGHLILDRHPGAPNLWIAGGGSGHGFKLAPAVGELMARAILEDESINPKFSLARLGAIEHNRTQFESQEDTG
ncbi:MAG: FAD-dependent oxidoreductase, partial [Acidobacteriota bacterium]